MTTTIRRARTLYEVRRTGRTRRLGSEFGGPVDLPEVEIVRGYDVPEGDHYDAVVELEGEHYYLDEDLHLIDPEPGCSAWVLSRTRHNFLTTGTEVYTYTTRTAPETCAGICAWPRGSLSAHGEAVFAVVPPERERVRAEREERDRRERRRLAALADFRSKEAAFEALAASLDKPARGDAFAQVRAAARVARDLGVFDGPRPLAPWPAWLPRRDGLY